MMDYYTMKHYSARKRNEVSAICSNMDGQGRSPCQVNCQAERQIYEKCAYCRILKYNTNELIYKTVRDSQT